MKIVGFVPLATGLVGWCPTCPPLHAALVDAQERLGEMRDRDSVVPPGLVARIEDALGTKCSERPEA